jgi:hypothetical protein
VGVAAAANDGITSSISEFVHVHDDDDTIEPEFFAYTVKFLDEKPHYMGVVSSVNRIDEKINSEKILCISKNNYSFIDNSIYIADILCRNTFTTNAFIYRRKALPVIGLYDENLPVLEDWDFNIRFLRQFDIGAIPLYLANYHFRVGSNTGGTVQTLSVGSTLHQEYTALIRNKHFRQDLDAGRFGIGMLISLGRYQQLQINSLNLLGGKIEALLIFRRILKLIFVRFRK